MSKSQTQSRVSGLSIHRPKTMMFFFAGSRAKWAKEKWKVSPICCWVNYKFRSGNSKRKNFKQSLITCCVVKLATGSFISAKTYIYIYIYISMFGMISLLPRRGACEAVNFFAMHSGSSTLPLHSKIAIL